MGERRAGRLPPARPRLGRVEPAARDVPLAGTEPGPSACVLTR